MNTYNSEQMYLEMKEKLINSLESHEFYEIFNRSIKSGKNSFSQYQRYMNNIIDVKWIEAIEDAIISLDNIIRNPMRFIKQEEEIVPIEQAKKISQESIRHLAQHTNMISKVNSDGSVTPTKILNIHKEETFATYENRFIYTLLKHLQYFIDKRLRLLNETKVNTENKIVVESEFKVGKEKIKYEFSLSSTEKTEKSKQSFKIDEDTSQMNLLQRVERLRKILYDFQTSQLIKNLDGCLLVKPPIMKTNVILKNPNFKKAMELWTFIESYNDAGLTVQVIENEEIPSKEYMEELFQVTLLNYYLFNHHVKPEKILEDTMPVSREFKPNLVGRTVEEYAEDFTLDIDEIERIFVDKVKQATKKRRENELKIKKAIERALEKEKAIKKKELEAERKRIEKEKLLIKNRILNTINSVINYITKRYKTIEIKTSKNNKNHKLYLENNLLANVKYNDAEYTLMFRNSSNILDLNKNITIINGLETNDWYQIVDNGTIAQSELKQYIDSIYKYMDELLHPVIIEEEPLVEVVEESPAEETQPEVEVVEESPVEEAQPVVETIEETTVEEVQPVAETIEETPAEEEPLVEAIEEVATAEEEPLVEAIEEVEENVKNYNYDMSTLFNDPAIAYAPIVVENIETKEAKSSGPKHQKHVYIPKKRVDIISLINAKQLKKYSKVNDIEEKIEIIKTFIQEYYPDANISDKGNGKIDVFKNGKLILDINKVGNNHRMNFQRTQGVKGELEKKYLNSIKKSKYPKGPQWFEITNLNEVDTVDTLSFVDSSYKYSVYKDNKAMLNSKVKK